jgi:hypothetical protein
LPRESMISRPRISVILVMEQTPAKGVIVRRGLVRSAQRQSKNS